MQKTKLGVSVGLVGAALYFLGCINIIPAFLLAAYVLLYEDSDWLKKTAIKMLIVVVVFNLLFVGVGLIQDVFGILNYILSGFTTATVSVPLDLDKVLRYVIGFVQDFVLIVMGLKALKMKNASSEFVEKIINEHM